MQLAGFSAERTVEQGVGVLWRQGRLGRVPREVKAGLDAADPSRSSETGEAHISDQRDVCRATRGCHEAGNATTTLGLHTLADVLRRGGRGGKSSCRSNSRESEGGGRWNIGACVHEQGNSKYRCEAKQGRCRLGSETEFGRQARFDRRAYAHQVTRRAV